MFIAVRITRNVLGIDCALKDTTSNDFSTLRVILLAFKMISLISKLLVRFVNIGLNFSYFT